MTTQITKKEKFTNLKSYFESNSFNESLKGVSAEILSPERVANLALFCVQKTPDLLDCLPASLLSAVKNLAILGCEPDGIHGYLVPFNTKMGKMVTPIPTAKGLSRMARANGINGLCYNVVHENDVFKWRIEDGSLKMTHEPLVFGDRGKMIGVYCVWRAKDNLAGITMSMDEIEKVRSKSNARNSGPWVDWFDQMALKTVVKRASKQWDLPTHIIKAMQEVDEEEFPEMRNITPKNPLMPEIVDQETNQETGQEEA